MRSHSVLRLFLILCLLLLASASLVAQDGDPPKVESTEEATPDPVIDVTEPAEPTEPPAEPGEPAPTDVPTDAPPGDEVKPTEAPPALPPVITLAPDAVFTTLLDTPLVFQMTVSDEAGAVTVTAETQGTQGTFDLNVGLPAESAAPFNTPVTVTYTPPPGFTGSDSIAFLAVDSTAQIAALTVIITVEPLAPAEETTPEPESDVTEAPTPTAPPDGVLTRELLIAYDPNAAEDAVQALLLAMDAVEIGRVPQVGVLRALVPDVLADPNTAMGLLAGTSAAQAVGLRAVELNGEVTGVQDEVKERPDVNAAVLSGADVSGQFVPTDPSFGTQWGLQNTTAGSWVRLAWDHSPARGVGVVVAVIDSGLDLQHPEFAGQIAPGGWDFVNDDNNPDDDHGHGTHVSGVIAARTNNALGIAGIAYRGKILPVKVLNQFNSGSFFNVINGVVYAVDKGARIINLSLGSSTASTSLEGAINYALSRNVTVIAAAGNNNSASYFYPASFPGVISVAAHDSSAVRAGFSNFNDRVWVSGPGVDIFSTLPLSGAALATPVGFGSLDGTSMASPHVAGIAGLLISSGVATTPAQVREALACGARDVNGGTLPGRDNQMGFGVVDADFAMRWRYNSATCKLPQPNDDFERATVISRVPYDVVQPIHSRSTTSQPGDPTDCISPDQTLWWRFRPTQSGYYQFTTFGSSYDTVIGVYEGTMPGALRRAACNDDFSGSNFNWNSFATAQLVAGQTYYIMVDGFGSGWNDEVLNLSVRRTVEMLNRDVQESATLNIAYNGGWLPGALSGASGGRFMRTTDNNATAAFSFIGDIFQFARVVGPDKGDTEVWIDGVPFDFDFNTVNDRTTNLNSRAAQAQGNVAFSLGTQTTGLHRVVIRRAPNSYRDTSGAVPPVNGPETAGEITLDRLRFFNDGAGTNVVQGIADNPDLSRFDYDGAWIDVIVPGSHLNTIRRTTTAGASVTFRVRGSAVTIFRNTAAAYGTANVYVDGVFYGAMNNQGAGGVKVPFVISGLSPSEHVVEVINGAASTLDFDAAQGVNLATLNGTVNENAGPLLYSGVWTPLVSPGFFGNTTRRSSDASAGLDFQFNGNALCLGYVEQPGGGSFTILVDGLTVATVDTSGGGVAGREWCSFNALGVVAGREIYAPGLHRVRILRSAVGVLEFDYVLPAVYNLITPQRGLVQQTDGALFFFGTWANVTGATAGPAVPSPVIPNGARSTGGALPQGGSMRRSNIDGSSVAFFINGTGLMVYTSVGPAQGCLVVLADGVVQQFNEGLGPQDGLRLNDTSLQPGRYRPFAFGITGLPRGIHRIDLIADTNCSSIGLALNPNSFVDLDGVRAYP